MGEEDKPNTAAQSGLDDIVSELGRGVEGEPEVQIVTLHNQVASIQLRDIGMPDDSNEPLMRVVPASQSRFSAGLALDRVDRLPEAVRAKLDLDPKTKFVIYKGSLEKEELGARNVVPVNLDSALHIGRGQQDTADILGIADNQKVSGKHLRIEWRSATVALQITDTSQI